METAVNPDKLRFARFLEGVEWTECAQVDVLKHAMITRGR